MDSGIKNLAISVASSLISALLLKLLESFNLIEQLTKPIIIGMALLILIIVFLSLTIINFRSLGIKKIIPSTVKGEGGTKSQMSKANTDLCFMGIGASKWVAEREEFEKTIRRTLSTHSGKIRFLLLDPESKGAKSFTLAKKHNETSVEKTIQSSLDTMSDVIKSINIGTNSHTILNRFEVRLYSQMPTYRLAIIDSKIAYLSFYKRGSKGENIKQLKITHKKDISKEPQNIFDSLCDYFENVWENSKPYPLN